jgi:hypothetical protein
MSRGSLNLFAGRLEWFAERVRALAVREGISEEERAVLLSVAADAEELAPRANAVERWCDSNVPADLREASRLRRVCCGPSPEGSSDESPCKPSRDADPQGEDSAAQSRSQERIIALAQTWWEDFRPLGWTEEMHLRHPAINMASELERALAEAVCSWLKAA